MNGISAIIIVSIEAPVGDDGGHYEKPRNLHRQVRSLQSSFLNLINLKKSGPARIRNKT